MGKILLVVAVALLGFAYSKEYNFNKQDYCQRSKTPVHTLSERATVIFRQPSSGLGATWNSALNLIPDECAQQFNTPLLSTKNRLEVRFDATKRLIKDDDAVIRFYDSDEVKASKKVLEVSKTKPVTANSTFTTTGSFLTIQVYRDYKNSKDYNVEVILVPVKGGAAAARWSFVTLSAALFARYLF